MKLIIKKDYLLQPEQGYIISDILKLTLDLEDNITGIYNIEHYQDSRNELWFNLYEQFDNEEVKFKINQIFNKYILDINRIK